MTDTLLLVTSIMSNKRQRKRQLKYHINQLLSELHHLGSNNMPPLNITNDSQLTIISHEENLCPFLSPKHKPAILHSTTNDEDRRKSKKSCLISLSSSPTTKFLFAASAQATSTPKSSPNENRILLKPHHTSTPRRSKRHSTALAIPPNHRILLKRILYNKKDNDQYKRRHSAVPFSKRSIIPRLHIIEENPQWI